MSEFNIEDLDAVIAQGREGSLAQMLALQLKKQIKTSEAQAEELAAAGKVIEKLAAENVGLAAENKKAVDAVTVFSNVTHDITEIICDELGHDRVAEIVAAYNDLGNMPATDRIVAGIKADGVEEFADKRGFSFQHGSIHAHLGNGDVMVGATKYENGHAGICFAPVREKDGGVGTEYKWTEGKNTNEVGAVFVIASSSVAGLEVIQSKLSEAIEMLREVADK